jgi:hypothetical protein
LRRYARRGIHARLFEQYSNSHYWLDLGNQETTANCVLGLFINDVVVRFASHLLYELFSKGRIAQHGVMINLDSNRSGPIDVDPLAWRRFGYEAFGADESEESSAVVG